MKFTGERVIPREVDPDLWAQHVSRYGFASRWASGARVLDLGCGVGYGSAELASRARLVVGIDLAPEAVAHATSAYTMTNTCFLPASATALPFPAQSFELIVAFEVIEHLKDWRTLLSEARRVLHPSGLFLVSTPNKEYYTESRGYSGPNPFHIHEFECDEFKSALTDFFPHCAILLQNHIGALAFYRDGFRSNTEARMDGMHGTPHEAHFFLAVCALQDPPLVPEFLFAHQGSNLLREREKHVESLQEELREARAQFAALHRKHDELILHLQEQNRWALSTVEEIEAARRALIAAEATIIERTLWAQKSAATVEDLTARLNLWRSSRWNKVSRKLNLGPDLDQSPI